MAFSVHVPRINNNDDIVKLAGLSVAIGDQVSAGQILAQVETDKAVVDVESAGAGYVLAILGNVEESVRVGDVLVWLGESADEQVPQAASDGPAPATVVEVGEVTAKARLLLEQYGISARDVSASGSRLTTADVEAHLASRKSPEPLQAPAAAAMGRDVLLEAGRAIALTSEERGMIATVSWHGTVAVPGYVEVFYDTGAWEAHAKSFAQAHKLLLSPLLPLMAWRLVEAARDTPRLNATLHGRDRHEYAHINCGFTVQTGSVLYLVVVRDALKLGPQGFVNELVELQRKAAAQKLGPREIQGATIGFSSMARWQVARHVPILAPNTALMVAHTVGRGGEGVLGATYDHRVLHGADVARLLKFLSTPQS